MLKKEIALGISDFKKLMENNIYFVDKSMLIKEFMKEKSDILVLPRPRRFGKTLNMSMIRYFLDNKENSKDLFEGLEVSKDKEFVEENLNKHPLIYLSLKDVKLDSWEESLNVIRSLIVSEYERHIDVLESLNEKEKEYYNRVIDKGEKGDLESSLLNLTKFLEKRYGKKAIVLIDEYDATIHKAYVKGYYKEAVSFFQMFYGSVFKDNIHLNKGLMTGILRVSKESIFSGLNNAKVVSILSDQFNQYFGFTEEETFKFVEDYGLKTKGIREWYNGYQIGDKNRVYNPWSVINYVDNNGSLREYWVNTSSNDLIYDLVKKIGGDAKRDILDFISGSVLRKSINENVNLRNLEGDEAFYSLLLFTGYLTWEGDPLSKYMKLKIPNMEVKSFFSDLLLELSKAKRSVERIVDSIEKKDWETFGKILERYMEESISYYDISKNSREKDYHLILMGVLLSLSTEYEIRSNRESGEGRYDIMLTKRKEEETIVFELKKAPSKDKLKEYSEKALNQIEEKGYGKGKNTHKVGVAFYNKKLVICSI